MSRALKNVPFLEVGGPAPVPPTLLRIRVCRFTSYSEGIKGQRPQVYIHCTALIIGGVEGAREKTSEYDFKNQFLEIENSYCSIISEWHWDARKGKKIDG